MNRSTMIAGLMAGLMLGAPALAGPPDNPGAAGQAVNEAIAEEKALGSNLGTRVRDIAKTDDKPGQLLQQAKTDGGGDPNPASDQGGGND